MNMWLKILHNTFLSGVFECNFPLRTYQLSLGPLSERVVSLRWCHCTPSSIGEIPTPPTTTHTHTHTPTHAHTHTHTHTHTPAHTYSTSSMSSSNTSCQLYLAEYALVIPNTYIYIYTHPHPYSQMPSTTYVWRNTYTQKDPQI